MAEFMAVEMAELIERGLTFVSGQTSTGALQEKTNTFLQAVGVAYQAGALGLAMIGRFGDPGLALRQWDAVSNQSIAGKFEAAAQILGISLPLARLIDANHAAGLPASVIAQNLRMGTLGLCIGGGVHSTLSARVRARRCRRKPTGGPAHPNRSVGAAVPTATAAVAE
jgi:hypothetical protein